MQLEYFSYLVVVMWLAWRDLNGDLNGIENGIEKRKDK